MSSDCRAVSSQGSSWVLSVLATSYFPGSRCRRRLGLLNVKAHEYGKRIVRTKGKFEAELQDHFNARIVSGLWRAKGPDGTVLSRTGSFTLCFPGPPPTYPQGLWLVWYRRRCGAEVGECRNCGGSSALPTLDIHISGKIRFHHSRNPYGIVLGLSKDK